MLPYYILELSNDPTPLGLGLPTLNTPYTLNLIDGSNYAVTAWGPKVAPRRAGALGNGPYSEVEEQLEITILGDTAQACTDNAELLIEILHDSSRWWDSQLVNPTYLTVQMTVSGTLWRSLVYVPRGVEYAVPSAEYNVGTGKWFIPLQIGLVRRGLWLGTSSSGNSGAGVSNPAVMAVSSGMPQTVVPAPTTLSLAVAPTTSVRIGDSIGSCFFVAYAPSTDRLRIYEAESGSNTVSPVIQWSAIADAGKSPSGGLIRRLTYNGLLGTSIIVQLVGFNGSARSLVAYAIMRNNSTTTNYTLTVNTQNAAGVVGNQPTIINIPEGQSTPQPQAVYLGYFSYWETPTFLRIDISGSATGNTLDFDYFVVCSADGGDDGIFQLTGFASYPGDGIVINPQPFVLVPRVYSGNTPSQRLSISELGDVVVSTAGNTLAVLVFGISSPVGQPAGNYPWRMIDVTDGLGTTLMTFSTTATRYSANLLPE